jgi:hypothetical protein
MTKKEEGWTAIDADKLIDKGWTQLSDRHFSAPKISSLRVCFNPVTEAWEMYLSKDPVKHKDGSTSTKLTYLRLVRYMYQIDNMYNGFTDRWLGYI